MARSIDPKLRLTLDRFMKQIRAQYPVLEARLYGSRARGDERPDSDIDVALILDGPKGSVAAVGGAMASVAFDVLLETELFVSPLPIWQDEWTDPSRHSNPWLLRNIRREGIAV